MDFPPPHLLRSPQLCSTPRNPTLLCISRRIIFRSICTPHLLHAFGPAAIGRHLSHRRCCIRGGRRRLVCLTHTSIAITISFIILPTLTHHLAFAICLHRSISMFPRSRTTGTTDALIRNTLVSPPLPSSPSLNYIPAASFRPSPRRYPTHLDRANIIDSVPIILHSPWFHPLSPGIPVRLYIILV